MTMNRWVNYCNSTMHFYLIYNGAGTKRATRSTNRTTPAGSTMILLNQAGVLNNWAFAGCMGHGKYCISVMRKSINMHDVLMHSVKRNISIANTQFPVNSCTSSRTRLHNAMKLCSRAPQISPTKIKSAWWYLCSEKRHSALRGNNIIWSLSQILAHWLISC